MRPLAIQRFGYGAWRRLWAVLGCLLVSSWTASIAGAVTFQVIGISGADPLAMAPGDTITIDVRVVADADEVYGVGASVYGYDEAVIDYVDGSGQAVAGIFYGAVFPGIGVFSGLGNLITNPLVETAIGAGGKRVWLFVGPSLEMRTAQPMDPGLDGVIGGGDAQFRFTFEAVAPGAARIVIGTGYQGDGVALLSGPVQAAGATIDVAVVGASAVPSMPAIALYTLLPMILIGVGTIALRRRIA